MQHLILLSSGVSELQRHGETLPFLPGLSSPAEPLLSAHMHTQLQGCLPSQQKFISLQLVVWSQANTPLPPDSP
jgi:hypothetical protein